MVDLSRFIERVAVKAVTLEKRLCHVPVVETNPAMPLGTV